MTIILSVNRRVCKEVNWAGVKDLKWESSLCSHQHSHDIEIDARNIATNIALYRNYFWFHSVFLHPLYYFSVACLTKYVSAFSQFAFYGVVNQKYVKLQLLKVDLLKFNPGKSHKKSWLTTHTRISLSQSIHWTRVSGHHAHLADAMKIEGGNPSVQPLVFNFLNSPFLTLYCMYGNL